MTTTGFHERRLRHAAQMPRVLGAALERVDWSREQLSAFRQQALRALLGRAKQASAWYAQRLATIDPESATEQDLARIPPMTKQDLMAHWNEIVCDPRLTLADCEEHLAHLHEPHDLHDEYLVFTSGGSSGVRGVFVYSWDEATLFNATAMRWGLRGMQARGLPAPEAPILATIGSDAPWHASALIPHLFTPPSVTRLVLGVERPMTEIVSQLNAAQPTVLGGYASGLNLLAREAHAGALRIAPAWVLTTSEPLLPEMAELIEAAWGVQPANLYATCDAGILGSGCGLAPGIHLSDDVTILEAVTESGQPVSSGETAAKVLVTPLFQRTLPLIRYEITDRVTPLEEPCSCGSVFTRIADVEGRLDDQFTYADGTLVHPILFCWPATGAT